jgi:hypothetical protein
MRNQETHTHALARTRGAPALLRRHPSPPPSQRQLDVMTPPCSTCPKHTSLMMEGSWRSAPTTRHDTRERLFHPDLPLCRLDRCFSSFVPACIVHWCSALLVQSVHDTWTVDTDITQYSANTPTATNKTWRRETKRGGARRSRRYHQYHRHHRSRCRRRHRRRRRRPHSFHHHRHGFHSAAITRCAYPPQPAAPASSCAWRAPRPCT